MWCNYILLIVLEYRSRFLSIVSKIQHRTTAIVNWRRPQYRKIMIGNLLLLLLWYSINSEMANYTYKYLICIDMVWYDMIWCDMMWYDVIWYDMMWYDVMWYDMIWYDVMWCDMIWYDVMWCDVMWCDVMWCDVIWFYSFTFIQIESN